MPYFSSHMSGSKTLNMFRSHGPSKPNRPVARTRSPRDLRVLAADSRLSGVEMAPPDPILGVSEAFKACTDPNKLNLGVGAYRTEELQPYVLDVVTKAEERMLSKGENKEYLPIDGLDTFKKATADLLLGPDSPALAQGRVCTLQSLSGTGSLRVGAAFINTWMPGTKVFLSNPTWGNHRNIFADAGVEWEYYRYFDQSTVGLDFDGMVEDIRKAPKGSVIVLHGCAHNPTGIDPTPEQWEKLADLVLECGHMAFFDVAYQGFASGDLEKDAASVRLFVEKGVECFVSQSYSKNLGLYAERVGAINVILNDADSVKRVASQMKRIARAIYSNPPVHGARIVAECVNDPEMLKLWKEEMEMMSGRITAVRSKLRGCLEERMPERDWSFVTSQIGMFSFTGLKPEQVENMTNKWAVFMTKDGRISLAGLNLAKCEYLADAIVDSLKV
uniref:Aspartate aminotransferase n=1 Tax=Tetraselmis sp. GSL018 TaxID=582737 RepID=A0A061RCX4_9CHLO|eukprot:CAMPEP_0177592446 /NCGR_PEP_ID=MMETSP0419_2-20121207/8567_1 /TAXON_ID=582737 /ORGANISM="Tetraselmis sp., Strain GSL018" /LENGTH=444 /DNA_ID=CAMNT_0019083319 /DNA_START=30 /DNA_END=1364 /DNA_ORIENTATION=+